MLHRPAKATVELTAFQAAIVAGNKDHDVDEMDSGYAYISREIMRIASDIIGAGIDDAAEQVAGFEVFTTPFAANKPVNVPADVTDVLSALCVMPACGAVAGDALAPPVLQISPKVAVTLTRLPAVPHPLHSLTDVMHRHARRTTDDLLGQSWYGIPDAVEDLPPVFLPGVRPAFHWPQLQTCDLWLVSSPPYRVTVTAPWDGWVVTLGVYVNRLGMTEYPIAPYVLPYKIRPAFTEPRLHALARSVGGLPPLMITPGTVLNIAAGSCYTVFEGVTWRAFSDDAASFTTFVLRLDGRERARITPQVTAAVKAGGLGHFDPATSVCTLRLGKSTLTGFLTVSFLPEAG